MSFIMGIIMAFNIAQAEAIEMSFDPGIYPYWFEWEQVKYPDEHWYWYGFYC